MQLILVNVDSIFESSRSQALYGASSLAGSSLALLPWYDRSFLQAVDTDQRSRGSRYGSDVIQAAVLALFRYQQCARVFGLKVYIFLGGRRRIIENEVIGIRVVDEKTKFEFSSSRGEDIASFLPMLPF